VAFQLSVKPPVTLNDARSALCGALAVLAGPGCWSRSRADLSDEALLARAEVGAQADHSARYTRAGAHLDERVESNGNPRDRYSNHLTWRGAVDGAVVVSATIPLPVRDLRMSFEVSAAAFDRIQRALGPQTSADAALNIGVAASEDPTVARRWLAEALLQPLETERVRERIARHCDALGVPGTPLERVERAPHRPSAWAGLSSGPAPWSAEAVQTNLGRLSPRRPEGAPFPDGWERWAGVRAGEVECVAGEVLGVPSVRLLRQEERGAAVLWTWAAPPPIAPLPCVARWVIKRRGETAWTWIWGEGADDLALVACRGRARARRIRGSGAFRERVERAFRLHFGGTWVPCEVRRMLAQPPRQRRPPPADLETLPQVVRALLTATRTEYPLVMEHLTGPDRSTNLQAVCEALKRRGGPARGPGARLFVRAQVHAVTAARLLPRDPEAAALAAAEATALLRRARSKRGFREPPTEVPLSGHEPIPPPPPPAGPRCRACGSALEIRRRMSSANEFDMEVTYVTERCPACGGSREFMDW
jgi:hypothetical protein